MRAGICTTLCKDVDIRFDVDWMKHAGVRGIVLWNRIRFAEPANEVPNWVFRHELEHAYQIIRDGHLTFYIKFFYYSVRYGYQENPYEIEAREAQQKPLTQNEEELLWKLRNGSTRPPKD